MDFLPGLVAPRVCVFVTDWVNKLSVFFTFLPFIFLFLFRDVGTLNETLQTLKHHTEHIKTSALEFQLASEQAPCLF